MYTHGICVAGITLQNSTFDKDLSHLIHGYQVNAITCLESFGFIYYRRLEMGASAAAAVSNIIKR